MVSNRVRRRLRATGIKQLRGVLRLPDLARRQRRDASVSRRDHDQRDLLLSRHPALRLAGRHLPARDQPAGGSTRKRPKSLRIWSAACSTGEEPYSIALKFLGKKPLFAGWKTTLLGTDLSGAVLDAARAGIYDARAVRLSTAAQRQTFFDEDPKQRALGHQARGQGARHLEAAQPALPTQGRAVRLHFSQKRADLF